MYRILVFASLVALFSEASGGPTYPRKDAILGKAIIGGNSTDITKLPYMVSIHTNGILICGGSILDEHTILTAGHCAAGLKPRSVTVRVGSSYFKEDGVVHKIAGVIFHDKFTMFPAPDYDVAIIRLPKPIEFSDKAKPISLPTSEPTPGTDVTVAGWGTITEDDIILPDKLRSVVIKVVDSDTCRQYYPYLTSRMLCAQSKGKDSCLGDSGGGISANGDVVGIVSFGYGCAEDDIPGVYTNVANPEILDFIKKAINHH